MDPSIEIFPSPNDLAEKVAVDLVNRIKESSKSKTPLTIALSGGSTPALLFSILGKQFAGSVEWDNVHLFWGDERCVPPDHPESNYGMTEQKLISRINIPLANIHRIRGEEDPVKESVRYSEEICSFTGQRKGFPLFDIVMLGLGEDGHTASIFPGHDELFITDKICEIAFHPVTKQKRITITGKVINNAGSVVFMVTGKNKAVIVERILNMRPDAAGFPASYISPVYGELHWLIDADAGSLLHSEIP